MHDSSETAAEPFGELVRDALKSIGDDEPVTTAPTPLATAAEPAPAGQVRVLARLAGGELLEAGSFASRAEAQAHGEDLAAQLAAANGRWPFLGWGFIRPELVVAVQLDPPDAE